MGTVEQGRAHFRIARAVRHQLGRWEPSVRSGAVAVVVMFVSSHAYFRACGIRLDVSPIPWFDQFLDPVLLRTRLFESVWHMHSQPPLFNLLTAAALKLAPETPQVLLEPVFLLAGLYTGLCLYVILVRLRLPVAVGALIASIAVSSPAFVLYENWYFYPHLNVAWLLGALAWLAQSRGRPGIEMTIAACHWAGLSLTRSLFHPLYFALTAVLVVVMVARSARRNVALCFLVPALALGVWCAKNQVMFGFFGTSSWGSRNVSHAVETLVGQNRVQAEARLGHLSPAINVGPFGTGTENIKAFGLTPKNTGIPALDAVRKASPLEHATSYNHWSYAASSQFYAADTRDLIATYPAAYLRGVRRLSLQSFLRPVDDNGFLSPNRDAIPRAVAIFDAVDGSLAFDDLLVVGLVFALLAAVTRVTPRNERVLLGAALLAIVWVIAIGLVGELGENNRFRFKIVWLTWAIAATGYSRALAVVGFFWREWLPQRGGLSAVISRIRNRTLRDNLRALLGAALNHASEG